MSPWRDGHRAGDAAADTTLQREDAVVRLLRVRDRRYPAPHWILLTRHVHYQRRTTSDAPAVEGLIALDGVYVGGPLRGRAGHVLRSEGKHSKPATGST